MINKNLFSKNVFNIGKSTVLLAIFALAGVLLLSIIYAQTEQRIKENQRQALMKQLSEVLPVDRYDNVLDKAVIQLPQQVFKDYPPVIVYLATSAAKPVAAIFMITTQQGYNGAIKLLVAVNKDQSIEAVRVVSHRETPGLGDKIDLTKNDWILGFNQKSLLNPTLDGWAVKKDQGEFDQFTGATITPRAIVKTVRQVLQWSQQHFDGLFTDKYKQVVDVNNH